MGLTDSFHEVERGYRLFFSYKIAKWGKYGMGDGTHKAWGMFGNNWDHRNGWMMLQED